MRNRLNYYTEGSLTAVLLLLAVSIRFFWPLQYFYHISKQPLLGKLENSRDLNNITFVVFLETTSLEKTAAGLQSWLNHADHSFIFSPMRNFNLDEANYAEFRVKTANEWVRLRMMTIYALKTLPLHSDWIIFAKDDSFLLVGQLKQLLKDQDSDELVVGVVGTENFDKSRRPINPIYVLSRGAFKQLASRINKNRSGCYLSSSLPNCLPDAVFLSFDKDEYQKYRYFPLNRHFSPSEMKDFTRRHGYYDDGRLPLIDQLSRRLLSFHNLNADDLKILDVLLNRVRLWPAE